MSGWLDGWRRVDNPRSGGGTYDPENEGYPYRIVLHTIEGRGFPNTAAHQYPPQLWYNPGTREKIQTIPLDRSGFALWQGSDAPYYTNRARAIQVEMVGFAEEAGSWPDSHLVNIAQDVIVPVVRWVQSVGGKIDLSDPAVPLPGAIPNSAREDAPQRLDPHVWAFGPIGICGHRHVPMGDDHWDAGSLDMRRIAAYARELLGTSGSAELPDDLWSYLVNSADAEKLLRQILTEANQAHYFSQSAHWHLGNFAPSSGREKDTVSARLAAMQPVLNAAAGSADYAHFYSQSAHWNLGNFAPATGKEDDTVSSHVNELLAAVKAIPVAHTVDPAMMPAAAAPVDRAAVLAEASVPELVAALNAAVARAGQQSDMTPSDGHDEAAA